VATQFIVHSLQEPVEIVVGHVYELTLSLVFLIVYKVEAEGSAVPVVPEGLQGLTLVFMVHDIGFEVEKVKGFIDRRESVLPSLLLGGGWSG
jgi:hypothetical protein